MTKREKILLTVLGTFAIIQAFLLTFTSFKVTEESEVCFTTAFGFLIGFMIITDPERKIK